MLDIYVKIYAWKQWESKTMKLT